MKVDTLFSSFAVVSDRNEVTKRHGNVIAIWRASGTEVTALLKVHVQK